MALIALRLIALTLLLNFPNVNCSKCTLSFQITLKPTNICFNVTESFPKLNSVYSVRCEHCNISIINENTISWFGGEILNLSNTNIEEISQYALEKLPDKSRIFIFDNNKITRINKWFIASKNITEISLKNNSIEEISQGQLDDLYVEKLDLSYNKISKLNLPKFTFKRLYLSHNKISEIQDDSFSKVILNKGVNESWKSDYKTINNSFSIYLNHNNISALYTNSFRGLQELNVLDLSNNKIETLPRCIFSHLTNLLQLNLANNKLKYISANEFSSLRNLIGLDLSHNKVAHLEKMDTYPFGKISTLDLSSNHFVSLDAEVLLTINVHLKEVVLNDNYWTCKDLASIYRTLVKDSDGFCKPSRRYNVPNFHGIACSKSILQPESFSDFLTEISLDLQDDVLEEETVAKRHYDDYYIAGIFYQMLLLTIMMLIMFAHFAYDKLVRYCNTHRYTKRRTISAANSDVTILL